MDSEEKRIYPSEHPISPEPLSGDKITAILTKELVEWRCITSPLPENITKNRVEMYREYSFETFNDAVDFLSELKVVCEIIPHHPRIENIWRTLKVYLTTWAVDYQITFKDVILARNLDRIYSTKFSKPESSASVQETSDKSNLLNHLRDLVAQDELETLFWNLNEHFSVNSTISRPNDFLLLSSQFNAFQKKRRLGTESEASLNIEINKIKQALLEVLNEEFLG